MSEHRIVVLQRGWVIAGEYKEEGEEIVVTSGSVVRHWGTTKGLPELAEKGPLKDTKLDASVGEIRAHKLSVVMTIKTEHTRWN